MPGVYSLQQRLLRWLTTFPCSPPLQLIEAEDDEDVVDLGLLN